MKRRDLLLTSTTGIVVLSGCVGDETNRGDSGSDSAETNETPEETDTSDQETENGSGTGESEEVDEESDEEEQEPEFTVTDLSVNPTTVGVGEEVKITIVVENSGEVGGDYEQTLYINETLFETLSLDLDSEENSEVEFQYTPQETGTFDVRIEDTVEEFVSEITEVGGVIQDDTTWNSSDAPFKIINTVQVPEDVTLEIEPGVLIQSASNLGRDPVFQLHGEIIAEGTESNPITINGKNNSGTFFDAEGSNEDGYLSAQYCHVKDGGGFWWHGNASFDLRQSTLENIDYSYIWYPFGSEGGTINIEYNRFINSGGFSTGMRGDTTINIRYNLFRNGKEADSGGLINNWASYDQSITSG